MIKCKYCKNIKWCQIVHWFGSNPIETIYNFVNRYKMNCHHYEKKWYIFTKNTGGKND